MSQGNGAGIEERLKKVILEQLMVEESELTEDASFVETLGADSLDLVEMIMEIEEEFGIEIPDEDAESLQTVGEALAYVKKKIGEAQSAS